MQAANSLTIPQGGHFFADFPPPDKNEYNEEIYWYLTQLHHQQMQQRAQNSSNVKVPSRVQQALNLNTAFLKFSQKLVEGLITQQMECIFCQEMHQKWLLEPSSSEFQAQILGATKSLDGMVDAHVRHAETDPNSFCLAKLSVTATLGQLQASQRLQACMDDLAKELWKSKEPFHSDESAPNEMLLLEWKVVENASKTLYNHYLYFLKCVEAAEDSMNAPDRDAFIMRVIREKKKFDQTASLLSSQFDQQDAKGKHPWQKFPTDSSLIRKGMGPRGKGANSSHSESWTNDSRSDRDSGWENVNSSRFQTSKGCVVGDAMLDENAKMAGEACNRLLESLDNMTLDESPPPSSSILSLSETKSLCSHDSHGQTDEPKEHSSSRHRETFTRLSQWWMYHVTGHALIDPKGGANAEGSSQDGVENASESSRPSNNNKGKDKAINVEHQSSTRFSRKKIDGGDGQDDEHESDENDRDRKKRKLVSSTNPRGYACPFYKNDPDKHERVRACSSTNYPSMHRLKEHLKRAHLMPIHCARCRLVFEKREDLISHQRDLMACELGTEPPIVGIDELQAEKLRSRKQKTKNEVEKWREMYRILFPDADELSMPSPYHDVQITSIKHYNSLIKQQVHKELIDYDKHQRLLLPVLIRSKLNTFGDAENSTDVMLTCIIEDCLSEVLKDYQLSSKWDDQRDVSKGNSVPDIGGALAQDQGAGIDSYSNCPLWESHGLGLNQQYDGSVQHNTDKAVSGGEFEFDSSLHFDDDDGFADLISIEGEAYDQVAGG